MIPRRFPVSLWQMHDSGSKRVNGNREIRVLADRKNTGRRFWQAQGNAVPKGSLFVLWVRGISPKRIPVMPCGVLEREQEKNRCSADLKVRVQLRTLIGVRNWEIFLISAILARQVFIFLAG